MGISGSYADDAAACTETVRHQIPPDRRATGSSQTPQSSKREWQRSGSVGSRERFDSEVWPGVCFLCIRWQGKCSSNCGTFKSGCSLDLITFKHGIPPRIPGALMSVVHCCISVLTK
jgi:hypothetical protein